MASVSTTTTQASQRDRRHDRERIVARARRPRHGGEFTPADARATRHNPSCGDQVTVTLLRSSDGQRLAAVRCSTRGCVLCTAAADLMAQVISGQTPARALALGRDFVALLQAELDPAQADPALAPLFPLAGLSARARCALLPWQALHEALAPPAGL